VNTVKFECQLTTPMFMAGAEQSSAELRAPSIKGLLRWWFRAAHASLPLKGLAIEEAKVFGSTEGASPVMVRIQYDDRTIKNFMKQDVKKEEKLDCKFDSGDEKRMKGDDAGIAYLFYSNFARYDKQTTKTKYKGYLKDGFCFDVILQSNKKEALTKAAQAFWLLTYFGGMGSRSRRGGGNFRMLRADGIDEFPELPQFNTEIASADLLQKFLQDGVKVIHLEPSVQPGFTVIGKSEVSLLKKTFGDWKTALNELGKRYEEYRFENDSRKIFALGAAFGMPIMHGKGMRIVPNKGDGERFASPIIFRVWKFGNNYFAGVITLESNLYSNNVKWLMETKINGEWKQNETINNEVKREHISNFMSTKFTNGDSLKFSLNKP
jgi:CRISPR-associated protein Cmr1